MRGSIALTEVLEQLWKAKSGDERVTQDGTLKRGNGPTWPWSPGRMSKDKKVDSGAQGMEKGEVGMDDERRRWKKAETTQASLL